MNKNFDWQAFLKFAKKIYHDNERTPAIDNSVEALCRIAISRAYYVAYHSSKIFLLTLNPHVLETSVGGSHESVINAFLARQDKFQRQIGRKLSSLKEQRVRADYISQRYPIRGYSGNVISELKIAIGLADDINNIIARCNNASM